MNGRQIRTIAMIVACVAIYTGATSAGKRLMTASDERRAWASSMNFNEDTGAETTDSGIAFFTTLVGETQFDVAIAPPSTTACDALMDYLVADQSFLRDLDAHGFTSIGCVRYNPDGTTVIDTRRIAKPASTPTSTEPHNVPGGHDAKASDARA